MSGQISTHNGDSNLMAEITGQVLPTVTVPQRVAYALRTAIVRGELVPGTAVVESALARQLQVGQPTVREALKVLEAECLIYRKTNRGCVVRQMSIEQVRDIYILRRNLEPLAIELALGQWSQTKAASLNMAYQAMANAAARNDRGAFAAADLEFHRTIWNLSDNPFLQKALNQVVISMFAFFVNRLDAGAVQPLVDNAAQHKAILDAMTAQNVDAAKEAMLASLDTFKADSSHFRQ